MTLCELCQKRIASCWIIKPDKKAYAVCWSCYATYNKRNKPKEAKT